MCYSMIMYADKNRYMHIYHFCRIKNGFSSEDLNKSERSSSLLLYLCPSLTTGPKVRYNPLRETSLACTLSYHGNALYINLHKCLTSRASAIMKINTVRFTLQLSLKFYTWEKHTFFLSVSQPWIQNGLNWVACINSGQILAKLGFEQDVK